MNSVFPKLLGRGGGATGKPNFAMNFNFTSMKKPTSTRKMD